MLRRFCAYSFLKDQRFIEPFLLLALIDQGWSFFAAGSLLGLRNVVVAVAEVPSGVFAPVIGYRRTLVIAFVAYIVGYVALGNTDSGRLCCIGAVALGLGESCRTGVHKAMIFNWLKTKGLDGEKSRYYGYTRSWGDLGSAMSIVVAASILVLTDSYEILFLATTVPFCLNIANILAYPSDVEPSRRESDRDGSSRGLRDVARRFRTRSGGWILMQSTGFDAVFRSVKDYVQPAIQLAVAACLLRWTGANATPSPRDVALLAMPVFIALHLLSATASRQAHRFAATAGSTHGAMKAIWLIAAALYFSIAVAGLINLESLVVVVFVSLYALQNLWRPLVISEIAHHCDSSHLAACFSVENLFRRAAAAGLMPLVGFAIDWSSARTPGHRFWPIGLLGFTVAGFFLMHERVRSSRVQLNVDAEQCA